MKREELIKELKNMALKILQLEGEYDVYQLYDDIKDIVTNEYEDTDTDIEATTYDMWMELLHDKEIEERI